MNNDILTIQQCFPRIYMACHSHHEPGKSNHSQLSSRDSTILAHLSSRENQSPSRLAKHLNVSQATISEATANLIELGYIHASCDENDGRRQCLRLTNKGEEALSLSSVLDADQLHKLLLSLSDIERQQALHGLQVLAQAALRLHGD